MTDPARDLTRALLDAADSCDGEATTAEFEHCVLVAKEWREYAEACRAAAQSLTDTEAQLAKEREAHRYTAQALVEACAARDAKDEAIATLRAELAESEAVTLRQSASIAELLEGHPNAAREARRAGQKDTAIGEKDGVLHQVRGSEVDGLAVPSMRRDEQSSRSFTVGTLDVTPDPYRPASATCATANAPHAPEATKEVGRPDAAWSVSGTWIALPDEDGIRNRSVNVRNASLAGDLVRIHNEALASPQGQATVPVIKLLRLNRIAIEGRNAPRGYMEAFINASDLDALIHEAEPASPAPMQPAAGDAALREALPLGEGIDWNWRTVALQAGELMAANGPDGYYTFTPAQWIAWARKQLTALPPAAAPAKEQDR